MSRIEARVTNEQKEQLKANAKRAGMSVTEYIIDRCCTADDCTATNSCTADDCTAKPICTAEPIRTATNSCTAEPVCTAESVKVPPTGVPKVRSDKHKGSWVQARREGRFKGTYEDYHDAMERY